MADRHEQGHVKRQVQGPGRWSALDVSIHRHRFTDHESARKTAGHQKPPCTVFCPLRTDTQDTYRDGQDIRSILSKRVLERQSLMNYHPQSGWHSNKGWPTFLTTHLLRRRNDRRLLRCARLGCSTYCSSTPPRPTLRTPCIHQPLRRLATDRGEKCGPASRNGAAGITRGRALPAWPCPHPPCVVRGTGVPGR